ncbi:hypothetical protein SOO42_14005, partial [Staphylococcus aureus]
SCLYGYKKLPLWLQKVAFMVTKSCLYGYKKLPLKSQMHCPSKVQTPPKKGFKKIYKKILKSSGQFSPHKFKRQKGKQPLLWLLFYL